MDKQNLVCQRLKGSLLVCTLKRILLTKAGGTCSACQQWLLMQNVCPCLPAVIGRDSGCTLTAMQWACLQPSSFLKHIRMFSVKPDEVAFQGSLLHIFIFSGKAPRLNAWFDCCRCLVSNPETLQSFMERRIWDKAAGICLALLGLEELLVTC